VYESTLVGVTFWEILPHHTDLLSAKYTRSITSQWLTGKTD